MAMERGAGQRGLRPPSVTTVRNVVLATIVLTLLHFTDNAVYLETYPAPDWQPDWFVWVVALSWPIFTAVGVMAYRYYRDGRWSRAHGFLVAYSYTGLVSVGHFISGPPSEFTTRGLVSVFVDIAMGSLVLATAAWSIVARRRMSAATPSRAGA